MSGSRGSTPLCHHVVPGPSSGEVPRKRKKKLARDRAHWYLRHRTPPAGYGDAKPSQSLAEMEGWRLPQAAKFTCKAGAASCASKLNPIHTIRSRARRLVALIDGVRPLAYRGLRSAPYLHHLRKYLTVEHGDRAMECMLRTHAVSMLE